MLWSALAFAPAATGEAAQPAARTACEAGCRDLYSGNPTALEACKRDCGTTAQRETWTCYEVCEFQCDNKQPCLRLCMKEC